MQRRYYLYGLPTEAEWEYACRATTTGDYAGDLDSLAWYANNSGNDYLDADSIWKNDQKNYGTRITNNGGRTHQVGTKQANAWGLYDMHGNVWEWCSDWYGDCGAEPETDPQGPIEGSTRVLKGGGSYYPPMECQCARREGGYDTLREVHFGFRVLVTVVGNTAQ